MSFDISMEFLGLNEMQKEIERLSTESELKTLNKKSAYRKRKDRYGRKHTAVTL